MSGKHAADCELDDHGVLMQSDRADAPCAACGMSSKGHLGCSRRSVEGMLIMLCNDSAVCAQRYRRGLTPAKFAEYLRSSPI